MPETILPIATENWYNRYNFRSKRDREKKNIFRRHEILLRIQCCNKKIQNHKKKNKFFPKMFFKKLQFFRKVQIFRKYKTYFRILEVVPIILTIICLFRSNSNAIN